MHCHGRNTPERRRQRGAGGESVGSGTALSRPQGRTRPRRMTENYTRYPNVLLGEDALIGPYVVLGEPSRGAAAGEVETVIGPRATIRSHTVIYAGNRIG